MASDYGDDAGEKMIEDFARFGERMGERAMYDRARRMRSAFENATAATRGAAGEGDAREKPAEWAKLDMAEFQEIEDYAGIKGIIEAKLALGLLEQLEGAHDAGLDLLAARRRPEEPRDAPLRDPERLDLVRLLLLHDRADEGLAELALLRKALHLQGLRVGRVQAFSRIASRSVSCSRRER